VYLFVLSIELFINQRIYYSYVTVCSLLVILCILTDVWSWVLFKPKHVAGARWTITYFLNYCCEKQSCTFDSFACYNELSNLKKRNLIAVGQCELLIKKEAIILSIAPNVNEFMTSDLQLSVKVRRSRLYTSSVICSSTMFQGPPRLCSRWCSVLTRLRCTGLLYDFGRYLYDNLCA
jgi:hypothetical protein